MTKTPHETFATRKKWTLSLVRLHPGAVAAAALLAFALIFWWVRIEHKPVGDEVIHGSNSDMYTYHLPVREFGFDRLRTGKIPLWNPYTNCGMPFTATYRAAIFYPLNFPHWFLPGEIALSLIYLMHIFLAGLFMYLWMRGLGVEPVAATFSGVGFMLCAFIMYQLASSHIILGHTWIPLVFLLIHRAFERGRWTDAALLGVGVSCQFLTGYMQGFVYTMYGAVAYAIFLTLVRMAKGEGGFRPLKRPVSMTLLGLAILPVALTAFQWVPTYLLSGLSAVRPDGLASEAIPIGDSLHPLAFLRILSDPGSYAWDNYSIYSGALTLLFAAFAFAHRERWRELVFFSALGLFSALLAFGGHTPLFDLYRRVPTGDWFRLPAGLRVLTVFALATLAGFGLNHLMTDVGGGRSASGSSRGNRGRYAAFIAISAGLILLLPKSGGIYIYISLVCCLIGVRMKMLWLLGVPAVLLVGADLTLYVSNPATFPWITRDVFPELAEEKAFLRENAGMDRVHVFRQKHNETNFLLNANFGMIEGIRETSGYESMSLQRYAEFCAYLETGEEPSNVIPFVGRLGWESGSAHPRMLNLLGARYIIKDAGRDLYEEKLPPKKMPSGFKLKKVFSGTLDIYENRNALPRAFFTNRGEVIARKRDVLERLADKSFDYRRAIILEEEPEPAHLPSKSSDKKAPAEVVVKQSGEATIDIVADVPASGFVFLNEVFVPGWRARVDGIDTKIYRADYLFMAIPVKAGKHSIEVKYVPAAFGIGVWISFSSALLLGLGLAFEAARSRTKRLEPWAANRR